ncbi:EXS [Macleaya cordata]|uniref:EXS n=1 Tax=Macleaya cordata TaxID=56857 RepID=A0A200QU66_MACCD|nr:EXS [Macleaya cordata]
MLKLQVIWYCSTRIIKEKWLSFVREAFLYYNAPFLLIVMVVLWGLNLLVFTKFGLNYTTILDLMDDHLTYTQVLECSLWMTESFLVSLAAYTYTFSFGHVAATFPPILFYVATPVALVLCNNAFNRSTRDLLQRLWRILDLCGEITFSDLFLAEVLTSLAKVLSDLVCAVCRMITTLAWAYADSICGLHSIATALVVALPFWLRLVQSVRRYWSTGETTHLWNVLQYLTATLVMILSDSKYLVSDETWQHICYPLWVISGVTYSLYGFGLDISLEWNMRYQMWVDIIVNCVEGLGLAQKIEFILYFIVSIFDPEKNPLPASEHFQECQSKNQPVVIPKVYYWFLTSNLILRCSWTFTLSSNLWDNYWLIFGLTLLEMFRRWQWILLRVENRHNEIQEQVRALQLAETENRYNEIQDQTRDVQLVEVVQPVEVEVVQPVVEEEPAPTTEAEPLARTTAVQQTTPIEDASDEKLTAAKAANVQTTPTEDGASSHED